MKSPFRYLIGVALGIVLAFFLPISPGISTVLSTIENFVMRIARYATLPMIFFSLPIAVTQLRRLGSFWKIFGQTLVFTVLSSGILAFLGTMATWIVDFGRIQIVPTAIPTTSFPNWQELLTQVFNPNTFQLLAGDGAFLAPFVLLAILLGWHLHYDKEIAEPTYNLFDSLSRVFYRMSRYLLYLMPGFLALIGAVVVYNQRMEDDLGRFLPILGFLLASTIVIIGGLYPLLFWSLGGRKSPWKSLWSLLPVYMGSFVSGSPLFNYANQAIHLKENMGVRRYSSALSAPLALMFARGGTAFVSAVCMVLLIRSYSSLEITLFQAVLAALGAFSISFALPARPDRSLPVALALMGALYGRGLEDGWLLLVPVMPLLVMIAALLDTATANLVILVANIRSGLDGDEEVALRY